MPRTPGQPTAAEPAAATRVWVAAMPAIFVLLWSTGFIGARLGLPDAEPLTFLLARFACVSVLLLAGAIIVGAPWPASLAQVCRIALVGLLLHGLYLGGVFKAISVGIPASIAALIVGLQPILTAALAGPYLGERLRRDQWIGLAVGFAGVVLVVGNQLSFSSGDIKGCMAAIVALLGITAGTLYQKRHGGAMNLITGSFIQFAAVGLAYVPLVLAFESVHINWTPSFVLALGWLTLVLSLGAITLLHVLIRRGATAKVASLFYLTPGVTAVLAYGLFGDTLTPAAIAGMVLAGLGVFLVTRR